MDEDFMNADSPTPLNPSLDFFNSAVFLRAQQNIPQSKYAQLLAVLEEMGINIYNRFLIHSRNLQLC